MIVRKFSGSCRRLKCSTTLFAFSLPQEVRRPHLGPSQTDDCALPGSSRPVTHRHGEVTDNSWNFGLAISSVSTQVSAVQKTVFLVTLKSKSTARRGNSGRACDFQPSGIKLFHYGRACWRNWKKLSHLVVFLFFLAAKCAACYEQDARGRRA